ncbi:MAG TPA: hypothetical protein PK241_10350, partial [Syntrophales bacterium]|nr:hypothetical protein [Syntrophales bacterium]
ENFIPVKIRSRPVAAPGPLPRKAHKTGEIDVFSLDKMEVFVYGSDRVCHSRVSGKNTFQGVYMA